MKKLFIALTAIFMAISVTHSQSDEKQFTVGDLAPDFNVKTIDGKDFRLSDHRGKYVLLNFGGTWCRGCINEIPELEDAQIFFGGENFEIVSVYVENVPKDLKHFADSMGTNWTHIIELFSDDQQTSISGLYGIQTYPSNFLLNKEGKIVIYPFAYIKTDDGKMRQALFAGRYIIPRLAKALGIEENMDKYLSSDFGSLFSITEPNAKVVSIAGNFTEWGPMPLYKYHDKWMRRFYLARGTYQYKFVVDLQWIVDPSNKEVAEDGKGNKNSLLQIK